MSESTAAQGGSTDMIRAIRHQERYGSKALDDLILTFRFRESLQQLLQDQPRCNHGPLFEGASEFLDLRKSRRLIATERQRPDARVYEDVQCLERSSL